MAEFLLVFIFTLFLLYNFRRQIIRWVFGLIGRKLQKQFEEAQKQTQGQAEGGEAYGEFFGQAESTRQSQSVGEIHVHIPPKQPRKRGTFKGGEYVDYEEV